MRRRTVLRRSAAIGAIAVAGCTGDGGGNGNDNGTGNGDDNGTASPTTTPDGFTGFGDYAIETTNTDCDSGSAGTADVSFDTEAIRVTITGTLEAPTPCYRASLEGMKPKNDSTELHVTISAKEEDVDACQECVGAIEYEATVDLEGGIPGTIVVKHGTGTDAEEVARVAADDA